jgi:hypothetical protein
MAAYTRTVVVGEQLIAGRGRRLGGDNQNQRTEVEAKLRSQLTDWL